MRRKPRHILVFGIGRLTVSTIQCQIEAKSNRREENGKGVALYFGT